MFYSKNTLDRFSLEIQAKLPIWCMLVKLVKITNYLPHKK